MMNKNGYLENNNGYGIFKSSGILALILPLGLFKWTSIALGPDEVHGTLDDCKFLFRRADCRPEPKFLFSFPVYLFLNDENFPFKMVLSLSLMHIHFSSIQTPCAGDVVRHC